MAYSGMFLRQYMGQSSQQIPNTTENWLYSPDLLVYGTAAAYSTSHFNSSLDDYESRSWYFSQPPTPGQANYVYVRGLSLSATQTSCIVHLFYCEAATLLKPKSWKSDTFSIKPLDGGQAGQNSFGMNWVSVKQLLVSEDTVNKHGFTITWTPPAATPAPHYYLIAWIDNSDGKNDPSPISDLPDFADMAALEAYVKAHPNMAMLDTWYNGVFLRQYAGQYQSQPGTGAQTAPDLIVTNTLAAPDPSVYTATLSYQDNTLHQDATLQMRNFIYPRAVNTSAAYRSARVYFYYTTSDQLSPAGWKSDTFTVAGKACNYVDIGAGTKALMVSQMPVVWRLDALNPGTHYILISYTDDSGNPQPPDFTVFGFVNAEMIKQFVATQPRMSWLEIKGSAPQAKPDMSYEFPLTLKAGKPYVGLQFTNIGTAGKVSFSLPGTGKDTTLVRDQMSVPDPNAAVTWPLDIGKDFNTSLVLNYWSSGGGSSPNIEALLITPAAS